MAKWVWNNRKTKKIKVDALREITVNYVDNNRRQMHSLRSIEVIGYYEPTYNSLVADHITLFTSDSNEECQKFVDDITEQTNGS